MTLRRRRRKQEDLSLAQGDLEHIYRKHYPTLVRYATTAFERNRTRAEDLAHDVFLSVSKTYGPKLAQMSDKDLERLLIRSARNGVIDVWRRDGRHVSWEAYVEAAGSSALSDTEDQFDLMLQSKSLEQVLEMAMGKLSTGEYRVLFMGLGDEDEKKDADIALKLGTTASTVKSLRRSGRRKLQACMRRDGYELTFDDGNATDRSESTLARER